MSRHEDVAFLKARSVLQTIGKTMFTQSCNMSRKEYLSGVSFYDTQIVAKRVCSQKECPGNHVNSYNSSTIEHRSNSFDSLAET